MPYRQEGERTLCRVLYRGGSGGRLRTVSLMHSGGIQGTVRLSYLAPVGNLSDKRQGPAAFTNRSAGRLRSEGLCTGEEGVIRIRDILQVQKFEVSPGSWVRGSTSLVFSIHKADSKIHDYCVSHPGWPSTRRVEVRRSILS
jgi:hypothetical protein